MMLFLRSPVADPGEWGGHAPPGPVKISHKKDSYRRRPHRFYVSCSPTPLPIYPRPLDKLSFSLTVKGSVYLAHTWLAVASPQVANAAIQFNTDVVVYAFGGKCVGIDQSWVYEYSLQSKSTAYDQCRLEMKHHVQKCHFCLEISLLHGSNKGNN